MEKANSYVGTDKISGLLQQQLLLREGCLPSSRGTIAPMMQFLFHVSVVLDIGCGNLHAGLFMMPILEVGHFVGLEVTN